MHVSIRKMHVWLMAGCSLPGTHTQGSISGILRKKDSPEKQLWHLPPQSSASRYQWMGPQFFSCIIDPFKPCSLRQEKLWVRWHFGVWHLMSPSLWMVWEFGLAPSSPPSRSKDGTLGSQAQPLSNYLMNPYPGLICIPRGPQYGPPIHPGLKTQSLE